MQIETYHPGHLEQLRHLINLHVSTAVPGWWLTDATIAKHLERNPGQPIIDPWVRERKTLCMLHKQRVVAAAHLLRYGMDEPVGDSYRNLGDIAWLVFYPQYYEAARELLAICHEQMHTWNVARIGAWDSHLPFPACGGVPDVWPHIPVLFQEMGYQPEAGYTEGIYGGTLDLIPPPGEPPVPGLTMHRLIRISIGVAFSARLGDQDIGGCECETDLTSGGNSPGMAGWAELSEMHVHEDWRNHGIGTWVVRHAAEWLRLAHCDRVVLSVVHDDEARGAGRFYNRFGWHPFTRIRRGWMRVE